MITCNLNCIILLDTLSYTHAHKRKGKKDDEEEYKEKEVFQKSLYLNKRIKKSMQYMHKCSIYV